MTTIASSTAVRAAELGSTGPSFTAALCGFLSTTAAMTALMFLLGSV